MMIDFIKNSVRSHDDDKIAVGLVAGGIYIAEGLAVMCFLSLYKSVTSPLMSLWWVIFIGTVTSLTFLTYLIGVACYRQWRAGSNSWLLCLAMNALVMAILIPTAEIAVRRVATGAEAYDTKLGKHLLYPRPWTKVTAIYKTVLAKAQQQPTFLISDEILGWTIALNRKSENGLYVSSSEGLRSAVQGVSLKNQSRLCRIAVIGDSYTFGENVAFEDTWASVLDDHLERRCQILNFGVIGYGIDQMYLRYVKAVRQWQPELVIVAFINDDLRRTMSNYGFLMIPDGRFPFIKPRFVLKDGELEVINRPLISPEKTFASPSIHDLPFINYDINYAAGEWDRPVWDVFTSSYLFRLGFTLLHHLDTRDRPLTSTSETLRLNDALITKLGKAIINDGARPLIVLLPTEWDGDGETLGVKLLNTAQIPRRDLTSCMNPFAVIDIFNAPSKGGHYSIKGNREVANCLLVDIKSTLGANRKSAGL